MSKKYQGRSAVQFSQNFLTSRYTIRQLIGCSNINPTDHVIEIGPGKGHITCELIKLCQQVTAVELDRALYYRLRNRFADLPNLALFHQDFMAWTLPPKGKYKIFANIPFNRSTDIVRKISESLNPPQDAWLIMERGAALRFCSLPRESRFSLALKPLFDLRIVRSVHRHEFHPKPSVDIVLLHMHLRKEPDLKPKQTGLWRKFLEEAFPIKGGGLKRIFTPTQYRRALGDAGMHRQTAGEILYVQWLCLFRSYLIVKGKNK